MFSVPNIVEKEGLAHAPSCTPSPAIYFAVFDASREALIYLKLLRT